MWQIGIFGVAAGAASALLFASFASGSLLSVPLFYLSPLPILLAALGWSHVAGLIGAMVAATALGLIFSPLFFAAFLAGVGLPAWWLGYLSLLARPVAAAPGGLEWYPVGKLVIWAAIIATIVIIMVLLTIAGDAEELRNKLRRAFEPMLADPRLRGRDGEGRFFSRALLGSPELILPPAAAVLTTLVANFLLWLGGRVVKASGRLRRPWPDLSQMQFPPLFPVALAATLMAAFILPGMPQVIAVVLAAALLTASSLLGLAVLHAITRTLSARGVVLGMAYGAMAVFGWPLALAAMLGLADMALDFRGRMKAPPSSRT